MVVYSKVTVNIKMSLKESGTTASFPHSFTDKSITRGWTTKTLKTSEIQKLDSLTFGVQIKLLDVYGASGNLIKHREADEEKAAPPLMKMSSELVLDQRRARYSELDALKVKVEGLLFNFEELSKRQEQIDDKLQSIVNELSNNKDKMQHFHQNNESSFKTFVKYSVVISSIIVFTAWYKRQKK